MAKRIIWISLSIFLFFIQFSFADTNAFDDFKSIRDIALARLPESFTSELTGRSIRAKLEAIPMDYIDEGKTLYVELFYSKIAGIKIEVKNVDPLYSDLFEQYVRFFTLGPILSTQNPESMLLKYDITYLSIDGSMMIINLRIKNAENNFSLFIDMFNKQIIKVEYYMGENIMSSIIIQYTEVERDDLTYVFPNKFIVKTFNSGESLPEFFEITNIEIN